MKLGEYLKKRRLELGLDQKDVASACDVSEATVSRWESGEIGNMRRDKIAALANVLKISPAVIVGELGDEPSSDLPDDFATPEEAVNWLMSRPILAAYGGKAVDEMTEDEKLRFAKQILGIHKAVSETIK